MKRKASPSPKASAYFSPSESGDSDGSSRRSASLALSPTPDRARFTKPPRATPDHRRGLRSPNPSPLSPRSRVPDHERWSPRPSSEDLLPGQTQWSPFLSPRDRAPDDGRWSPAPSRDLVSDRGRRSSLLSRDRDGAGLKSRVWLRDRNGAGMESRRRSRERDRAGIESRRRSREWDGAALESKGRSRDRDRDGAVLESRGRLKEREGAFLESSGRLKERDGAFLESSGRSKERDGAFLESSGRRRNRDGELRDSRRRSIDRDGAVLDSIGRSRDKDSAVLESRGRRGEFSEMELSIARKYPQARAPFEEAGHQVSRNRDNGRTTVDRDAGNGHTKPIQEDNGDVLPLPGENAGPHTEAKMERQRPVLPLGRSGGVYIPPFKLAQMMRDAEDKSSNEYQRLTWDALRKSINGLVNKVNGSNLKNILPELFSENLIRGRGLFARSCMKSQMASPTFTHVFAALVAVVNTKFPELGELLLRRIILQWRRAFRRNDKPVLLAAAKFIAHLVNQRVAHEILALELLTVLLENPTDASVEVAVGFVKECGSVLQNLSPQGLHGIFERFRGILHEGEIDKRVQFMIEGVFALRKAKFQGFAGVLPELDLVEEEDQITHDLELDGEYEDESNLDVFKPDPNFVENEKKYEVIKKEIIGDDSEEEGGEDADKASDEDDSDEEEEDEDEMEERMQIQDETETNLVNLRRTIYLTIMSSVDFEEAGHKLLKIKLEPGQEMELCVMLLECCSQERTYLRYYGLLGQRFCLINRVYQENFDQCFVKQYSLIHRLETNKLRNVAKFFAHLLGTEALPWQALAYIRLTEEDTTSSSRIFIKILFQELSEHLGLRKLNERLSDPIMQESFDGIFPKDNPKNTRFAINFFTSIGLGGLTDSLREYLKNMPRLIMQQQPPIPSENEESDSSSKATSSGSDSSDSDSSESDTVSDDSTDSSDTSEDEKIQRKKKRRQDRK